MSRNIFQPQLRDDLVTAVPLEEKQFKELFFAAADPFIWEQHPNKNRWQEDVFENYFRGAIESGGALLVSDTQTGKVIGSSRYYDHNNETNAVCIGYTFFARDHWGTGHNYALKILMLNHIFQWLDTVFFYIGAGNRRSQVSLERFGAKKIREEETAYYGEPVKPDFVYVIESESWQRNSYARSSP